MKTEKKDFHKKWEHLFSPNLGEDQKIRSLPKMAHFFPRIQVEPAFRCSPESNYWGGVQSNYFGDISPHPPQVSAPLVLVILLSTVVSGSFSQHIQITSNITTSPFLPNNEMAANYPALKLMTQIGNDNQYQRCSWHGGGRVLGTIFSSGVIPCSNRTELSFKFTCDETNKFVTTTVAFLSPVQQEDGGLYQVLCRSFDLSEVIIAQVSIMVSGKSLMAFYNILYKSCFFWLFG